MARITSYPKHIPVQPNDTWIGTRASNLMTRNFTAKAVGEYINISGLISISACMLYKFEITNAGPGDITGVPDLTPFANITSLNINAIDISGQNTVGFLEYIVGTEILISEQNEISTFGHYNIDSYTQIGTTSFYTLNLTFIGGSGSIEEKKQYDTCSFVLSSTDNNTTYDLDSIQNGANSDIRLIGSDLTTDIVKLEAGTNVTLTDTGSNILIDVTAVGTVTSIDASIDGDSLSIAGVPITSAGTIAFNWEGTNLQYVDGEGNLQTFPTLPTGTVTSVGQTHAGNAFSVTGSPITTAGVLAIGLNGNATQYIDGAGDLQTFPAIPVVPSNIVETLDTTDGTYIDLTPNAPTTGDVVVTADLSAIDGNAAAGERYLTKTNKWAEISTIPGTYEWEIQGDTGGPTVVNSTNIVTFVGGTNVSTALVGTTLTIDATDTNTTYDLTVPVATTNITLLGSDASSDSVTLTGGTNITVTRVSATELSIDGTDLNTTYNLEGVGSVDGTAGVRLAGSDASNDDVLIIGAGTTTVTRSLNTLTVTSNDQFDGTVTNVSASTTGDALDVAVTSPTTTPDLDFTWAGTASQYVDGQGDLQTFPAIPVVGDGILTVQGTGVLGGTGTFTANQAGNTTISVTHDAQSQSNTTPTATLTHGGTFTAISANVGVNASGHVTGQELTTFTLPSDTQGVTSVNFNTDGDALNVVSNTITTSGTMTGVWQGASSQYVNGEGDLRDITSIPGTYEWDIAGDSGSGTVGAGDIINFAGGTNVTTAYSGTTLTINSTDQFQGTVTSVATTHAGNAFTATIGGVATVNPSVDITMNGSSVEYVDGTGNLQTFPAIPQGDITDVEGGTYITTVNSTGPIVTVNHDSTSRTDNTSTIVPAAGDTVTAVDSVTTNPTGHVTGLNLKSIVLPTASESSETIDIQVKNISSANGGVNLVKGDPVYIYGSVGASARLLVDLADANSTATNNLGDSKIPCVALLDQDLAPNIEGTATVVGKLRNLITSPIDGVTPSENDTIYVKSGGGLTLTKPTGSTNLIQNVGQVGRVSTSTDGNIVVAALLRTNDVPNLPTGRLFVGTAANTSLASDVVYVDDTNDRVGINTATPIYDLDVDGAIRASEGFIDNTFTSDDTVRIVSPDNATYTVASGGETGAIKIQAPLSVLGGVTGTNTKVSFKVNISDGVVIQISGTFSRPGVGVAFIWTALSVTTISNASTDNNYTITADGSGSGAIWIGSSTDSQAGLKSIWVTDCQVSGGNGGLFNGSPQSSAWDISINASVPTGFTAFLVNNTQVTNWKRNGQDVYYGSGSGNVGIGTTSPSEKLVVRNGTSNTDVKILAYNSAAGTEATLKFSTIASETNYEKASIIARNAAASFGRSDMHFALDSAADSGNVQFSDTKMTILNSGNVGIGTTSPKAKLHVVNGTSGATWTATAGTTGIFESSTSDRSFVTITGEDEAELWFGDFTTQAKGRVRYQTDTNVMSFWTNNSQKITIDATANVGNISNVGIGTTVLTTISSPVATLSLGSLSANVSGGIAFQVSGGVVKAYNYVANDYLISNTVSGIGQIFYGAGSEQMRIHNTTGNVGIGTTNPGAKLDVAGNIIVSGGVSNENDGARVTSPGGASFITQTSSVAGAIKITLPQAGINTMMRMEVKVYEYLTNESFTVQCGGYSAGTSQWYNEYAYIESSAKDDRNFTVRFGYDGSKSCIYIGELTSAWSYPQVFVTEFQGGYLNTTGYKDGWDISFEASAFQGVVKTQANTQINNWARSGTNTYYASSTGGVGIGVTSPSAKLDVVGTGSFSDSVLFNKAVPTGAITPTRYRSHTGYSLTSDSNYQKMVCYGYNGISTNPIFQVATKGFAADVTAAWDNDASTHFTVLAGGNVGIGTTSPSQKLHVAGIVASTANNGFEIINSYGSPRLSDFYGSFYTTTSLYVGGPYSGQACYASAFNITSDYRLKENKAPLTEASSRIKKLKPIRFNYISSENTVDGFLAHEVGEVIPEAVTGEKDAVREDGSDELQGLDLSKIVPLLTAALQESIKKIEQLEQRIKTLENK